MDRDWMWPNGGGWEEQGALEDKWSTFTTFPSQIEKPSKKPLYTTDGSDSDNTIPKDLARNKKISAELVKWLGLEGGRNEVLFASIICCYEEQNWVFFACRWEGSNVKIDQTKGVV